MIGEHRETRRVKTIFVLMTALTKDDFIRWLTINYPQQIGGLIRKVNNQRIPANLSGTETQLFGVDVPATMISKVWLVEKETDERPNS